MPPTDPQAVLPIFAHLHHRILAVRSVVICKNSLGRTLPPCAFSLVYEDHGRTTRRDLRSTSPEKEALPLDGYYSEVQDYITSQESISEPAIVPVPNSSNDPVSSRVRRAMKAWKRND